MISTNEVQLIASYCKLRFNEQELSHMVKQLSNIVDMMGELEKIDCTAVAPMWCFEKSNRMRPDQVKQYITTDQLLSNVPQSSANIAKDTKYFVVPKIIE
ncbi:aspartyl/glutamyl-tRNA(Asn/Gln) amidotransferase, C subunit [Orientia chuto str. Dubai]|uniref:Aspartyl/glutamyl-tRNA(Asn/Gln) amidotransferase subunit C n=2 Tax=Candidatus Orientia mediorientalis TaxID=911112 RepID=A0A0F3MP77_9RICK|nr:aspartyl/glutamyl-tRNA(Asn/Gln) amidotransferase, C subunit [Orientia chuto str. Dubai]